ncbi:hypothetical protein VP01_6073g1 [Puccinia sorghi]|uniref:Uncharacterized protein n=1 Tax=Puccinia sorghi TaxID=27349 RepID=A0A0L6UH55_9BASI|nr:hypothetical protein VP01_6073g1 [Puccinia sorghi]
MAIPMNISLVKNIIKVKSTHDSSKLIMPAKKMAEKLKKYVKNHQFIFDHLGVNISASKSLTKIKASKEI